MKALLKTLGIIVIATIIGFSMTACGDGGGGGGGGGGPIALSENQWTDGIITEADGYLEYTFTAGYVNAYRIWWNDGGQGDGSYTGDIVVSAFRSNGDAIASITKEDSAWGTARSYTLPTPSDPSDLLRTETILLRVELKDNDADNGGSFAIVYSTLTQKPPIFPSSGFIPLTVNQWKDGNVATANTDEWYSLSVTNDTTYYFWWNETGTNGNNTKSGDVAVSAYYSNGNPAVISSSQILGNTYFVNRDSGWSSPVSFKATSSGTLYVKVNPYNYSATYIGTYGIVYSTTNTKPTAPFNVPAIALTEDEWKDGNLTNASDMDWYSIEVTTGTTYNLWSNERTGNGTKTGDVAMAVFSNDGNTTIRSEINTSWGTATPFTATYTGIVYVRVRPNSASASNTGTYGIVYSTTDTRPTAPFIVHAVPLNEFEWEDGNLTAANSVDWYSIEVTNGTTYNLWWNDRNSGNSTKSGDIKATVFSNDGTIIVTEKDSSWTATTPFSATYTGTVYIRVVPYSSSYTGTYGIVYSTKSTRPLIVPDDITELTVDVWEEGEIATNAEDWYSFDVTSGTTYYLWWNENGGNGNYLKTGNVSVSAWYLDGTVLLNNVTTAWATAASFSATSTDTVYVRVTAASGGAGTYGIVYKESNNRPIAPFNVTAIPLAEIEWKDGNLTAANSVDWYSIEVTNGTTYNLWWNDSNSGDGTKRGDIKATVMSNDGTIIVTEKDSSWTALTPFSATYTGTVYIRVVPFGSSYTGTYGIVYSTKTTRPLVLPANITALVADQWTDGNIPGTNGVEWFSISVTNGATYQLWWNETGANGNGAKTADIRVSATYRDGTIINLSNYDTAWATPSTFTASSAGIVYVVATTPSSSNTGTYGIVYSTTSTRPKASITGAIPLVETTWANGTIGEYARDWYSISVTNGTTYYLWWNERPTGSGNDTKTGSIAVSAWYDNGNTAFNMDRDTGWTTPTSFQATLTGTVYVRVTPYGGSPAGTYGIVYSTVYSRPTVP